MSYLENKKSKAKIITLALGFILNISLIPLVHADFTCDSLGHAEELKGKIVTIIEEPIGTPGTDTSYTVINCFRQTICNVEPTNDNTNGKISCQAPKFGKTCTPNKTTDENGKITSQTSCQPIQAYIADSGTGLLYAYVGNIYRWSAGIIGIVTVLYMVIGGVEVAASNGDSAKLEKAKERIIGSIAGLVLLFLSGLLLYTINPNFFVK